MSSSDSAPKAMEVYFQAGNDSFRAARDKCSYACQAFNAIQVDAPAAERVTAWRKIIDPGVKSEGDEKLVTTAEVAFKDPSITPSAPFVKAPIQMDYGLRVHIAPTAFINKNCTILDTPVADIRIGENVNIGPNVTIISVNHSKQVDENSKRLSCGSHVTIGDCAWICARVAILPGITIGEHSIVGAASVVTKDVPPYTRACGNPAAILPGTIEKGVVRQNRQTILTLEEALQVTTGVHTKDNDGLNNSR
ncbi:Fc.00g044350.m01.CDS01 [Cosmosporella sp. VM-42]